MQLTTPRLEPFYKSIVSGITQFVNSRTNSELSTIAVVSSAVTAATYQQTSGLIRCVSLTILFVFLTLVHISIRSVQESAIISLIFPGALVTLKAVLRLFHLDNSSQSKSNGPNPRDSDQERTVSNASVDSDLKSSTSAHKSQIDSPCSEGVTSINAKSENLTSQVDYDGQKRMLDFIAAKSPSLDEFLSQFEREYEFEKLYKVLNSPSVYKIEDKLYLEMDKLRP